MALGWSAGVIYAEPRKAGLRSAVELYRKPPARGAGHSAAAGLRHDFGGEIFLLLLYALAHLETGETQHLRTGPG